MKTLRLGLLIAGLSLLAPDVATSHDGKQDLPSPLVQKVRHATAKYRDVNAALADGYVAGACVSGPNEGAMGVHFVKESLLGDGAVDATRPELLIYEPMRDGRMRLVGAEFITFKDAWEAFNPPGTVPVLDGHQLHLIGEPNRYGIPAAYELHVWAWRHNPNGAFADWNPNVSCEALPIP